MLMRTGLHGEHVALDASRSIDSGATPGRLNCTTYPLPDR
jgi:hypothetical protein